MSEEISEFGKGFIYNLILFSKHWWRHFEDIKRYQEIVKGYPDWSDKGLEMWFNGASDHFSEFIVPPQWENTEIGKLAKELQNEAIKRGLDSQTSKADFDNFFERLEYLARLIDKELGCEDIKAQWT